jgi:hypothetical protein
VASTSNQPSNIPAGTPDDGGQLGLLLDAAKDMLGEEIRRSDRLETRARHMSTACGALFAVVMATTAGILNALLNAQNGNLDDWVIPVLGGAALASIVALGFALAWTLRVQTLRETAVLDPETFDDYIEFAEQGNVAVAKNLIGGYAQFLRSRREKNDERARDLKLTTWACGVSAVASLGQLFALFVALLSR